jgi:hypothetical protein
MQIDRTVTGKIYSKPKFSPPKINSVEIKETDGLSETSFVSGDIGSDCETRTVDEAWYSDSGEDDIELAERTPMVKKNRRGQRARQAIWEMKFGKTAKHIVNPKPAKIKVPEKTKEEKEIETLHPSWQAKLNNKTAIIPFSGKKTVFGVDNVTANVTAEVKKDDHTSEAIHPSWEAKRKAKEIAKEQLQNAKRTKIIFED